MPNILDATGLQTATEAELLAQYDADFRSIYGQDINLDSDTPDGQLINILIQSALDVLDLLTQIYNSFDPDLAVGVVLDQRIAINGIQRQAGTYTITPITLTLSQSVNLYGIDQTVQDIYTVADNAGTQWVLQETVEGLSPGTHILNFRAALIGATLTVPNTINVPVTVVLGVTSINNPSTYSTLGINEEQDAVVKIRRAQSVSLSSQGYLEGLLAALKNINGITSAFVYENDTSITNSDGVPGHTIWVIVAGTAADADIAQAIYTKRNAGAGMYSESGTTYTITQVDGTPFVVRWDFVQVRNLFIAFTASSINGTTLPDYAAIKTELVAAFQPGVNETVNINQLATIARLADPNALITGAGFTSGESETLNLSTAPTSGSMKLNYAGLQTATINWNDSAATVQSKVRAVAGLETVGVTGSFAGQSLVFDMNSIPDGVQGLLTVSNNTLVSAGPTPVVATWDDDYSLTLAPPSKRNQFTVSAPNIIILPMQLLPAVSTVAHGGTVQFTANGGYGSPVFSVVVNASGGSIDGSTGLYTSGATPGVDFIQVTDSFGNIATAGVTVT